MITIAFEPTLEEMKLIMSNINSYDHDSAIFATENNDNLLIPINLAAGYHIMPKTIIECDPSSQINRIMFRLGKVLDVGDLVIINKYINGINFGKILYDELKDVIDKNNIKLHLVESENLQVFYKNLIKFYHRSK